MSTAKEIQDLLEHWIRTRYDVFMKKEKGLCKPWTEDKVFWNTYFCNVHRENDRVTRWIRNYYNPYAKDPMYEYNIVLARFINWPPTLAYLGYQRKYRPIELRTLLNCLAEIGDKVWGGAYVITTHGQKMAKTDYLVDQVLADVAKYMPQIRRAGGYSCAAMSNEFERIAGIGTFLAAQIVADLKNTPGHPLYEAPDKQTYVRPGPGSVRGLAWWHFGGPQTPIARPQFMAYFKHVREDINRRFNWDEFPYIDNQDLQNCLCEFDKYMRVRNGTGRSKRSYNGS